jgi:hypothetical protein
LLAARVWALWKGSYIILTIYFLILSSNFCNYLFTNGIGLIKGTIFLQQLPFTGCIIMPSVQSIIWIALGNGIGFETVSIGLIIYKTWPLARLRGVKTPLFSLVLEDGLAHYLCFVATKLVIAFGIGFPTAISPVVLPAAIPWPVVGVVVNRLFLRLQRIMLNKSSGATTHTVTEFFTTKYATSDRDEDGSKRITTVGGSDRAGRRMYARRPSDLENELFSLGGGDIEMSLSKKDGERHTSAAIRRRSVVLPTSTTVGSLSNMDFSVLESKPGHVVE